MSRSKKKSRRTLPPPAADIRVGQEYIQGGTIYRITATRADQATGRVELVYLSYHDPNSRYFTRVTRMKIPTFMRKFARYFQQGA